MKRFIPTVLTAFFLAGDAFAADVAAQIDIANPTARAVPAGAPNSAGYLVVENRDSVPHRVVAAHSDIAASVELHTHAHVNGVMQMRQVDAVELPAGEQVVFKPGGLHVMFIGLNRGIDRGSEIAIELEYEDGSRDPVTLVAE